MSTISIITPFKDAAPFLKDCIDSICRQSHDSWQLIAIDDHSEDHSRAIIESYKDPRIEIYTNKGKGILSALQTAQEHIKGNYVTRMDADDIMPDDKLKVLLEVLYASTSKTISTVDSTTSSTVITVDSTVSFPSSGAFYLEDGDDTELITYQSKNINQFVDCSVPSRTFKKGSTVRSVTSVYGYENNDESKKVELIITGVLNDFESGSISSLSGTASSAELQLKGTINGTGVILGSDTILGSGVVSGTGSALDGLQITGKIIGTISKSLVDGIIYETGNPLY